MSTRKRQDWSRATSIYFTEDPPREQEDPDDMVGFYDIRRRHLWIDPNTEEKTADWEVPRTKAGTLSHEISHFTLLLLFLNFFLCKSSFLVCAFCKFSKYISVHNRLTRKIS